LTRGKKKNTGTVRGVEANPTGLHLRAARAGKTLKYFRFLV